MDHFSQKRIYFFYVLLFYVSLVIVFQKQVFAQQTTPTDTPTPTPTSSQSNDSSSAETDLLNQINGLESTINNLQGQANSIANTIEVMKDKISLSESQIALTKEKIASITNDINASQQQITHLNGSLKDLTKLLLNRIVLTYEDSNIQPIEILATSNSVSDYVQKRSYLQLVQEHDRKLIYDTQQAQDNYVTIKNIREDQKKQVVVLENQLVDQTNQLDKEKSDQESLLAQTNGNIEEAQRQLAQDQAELAGFSNFVTSQGGASLLSGQTACDSWGCYYNQRDSQWGGVLINGQGGYSVAGYGCLITSIAMVASHMGHNISPGAIASSDGSNFSFGTAMLKYTISVSGLNIGRSGVSPLDNALSSGPVIVGIYAYGGTHFVVIKSGSGGNYVMDDPYIPNGHDINFTDHYSLSSIFEMDQLSIQ